MRKPDTVVSSVFDADGLTDAQAANFGREISAHRHTLHQRELFTEAGLAELLDSYPRDRIGVYTMDDTPDTWRNGRLGDITGSELLEAVRAGRIWLNLRAANQQNGALAELHEEIFAELRQRIPGFKPFRTDTGLLISSPNARVFYHLDVPRVMLWHLSGIKRIYLYPAKAPFIFDEDLENVVTRRTEEEVPYSPGFDSSANIFDLHPGDMVHWPQNAPHRIDNGPTLNVSLSIEFMTPMSLMRANVIHANSWLRRRLGMRPQISARFNPLWIPKIALSRVLKWIDGGRTEKKGSLPVSFILDRAGLNERQAA